MREGDKKKPKEAARLIRALKGASKKAVGAGWEGTLTEWVKGIIQPCIKKPRNFTADDYSERLEKRAKWVVKTYTQKILEDGKDGGIIEL